MNSVFYKKNMKQIKNNNTKKIVQVTISLSILSLMIACTKDNTNTTSDDNDNNNVSNVEFVDIAENGEDITSFKLAKTEVTNQQYVEFLNSAMGEGLITVVDENTTTRMIYDKNGNQISNILGYRVIKDHDKDGIYKLWEMENPLNRSMIDYNSATKTFSVIDPSKVDWSHYFDTNIFPNAVDKITDWGELHDFWPAGIEVEGREVITFTKNIYDASGNVKPNITFAGHLDMDCILPTLEEVKQWPANHIQYYGAKAFADYYNYLIPSIEELRWAGKGGNSNWEFSTEDGSITSENTVFNGGWDKSEGKHKGHPQVVAYFNPNPYGVYDLGGSVTEWTRSVNQTSYGARDMTSGTEESMVKIDGAWPRPTEFCKISSCVNTDVTRGNDHFGFRVRKK